MSKYLLRYDNVKDTEDKATGLSQIQPKSHRRIELAPTPTRGEALRTELEIDDQDVVALELEGGFKLWMNGARLRTELARPHRDGEAWELVPGLPLEDSERGPLSWAIKALEHLGLDPIDTGVEVLARHIERDNNNRIVQRDPGEPTGWRLVDGPIPSSGDNPILLLLHGTFSTTADSFAKLATDRRMQALSEHYGGRIYGFDHRTLTEDPADNLLGLIDRLPDDTPLHVLSYSRGGLVGDLLAFAARDSQLPFGPDEMALIGEEQGEKLEKLAAGMVGRRIRVERFVRVASPSRGTTLASGRLDRWFSILANLAGLVGESNPVSPLVEGFLDLLVAVTQKATRPDELPGLAAMTPGSPLIRLLNTARQPVPSQLAAVAGDIEGEGWWSRVKLLIPDLFFAGEHDLVVNTGSMYGGPAYARRTYLFDQGPKVDHFSYFLNDTTAVHLVEALTGSALPPAFRELPDGLGEAPAGRAREAVERLPVLFVLPGIMGSALAVDGRKVWLDLGAIATGRIAELDLDAARQVRPDGLLSLAYGQLLNFFRSTHDLVPFAYDWRLSVRDSATALAEALEVKLAQAERHRSPVHILAHSMGGLVARAMIADHPRLWRRIRALGGRLLMLGTPNDGSWEIVRLLTGQATTLKQLALLDLAHGKTRLLEWIGEFPGVLELLPHDAQNFFKPATWERLRADDQEAGFSWHLPGERQGTDGRTRLAEAGTTRARLRRTAQNPDGMIYVAGQAPITACGVRTLEVEHSFLDRTDQGLEILGCPRGDGAVLWEDGPLPGMATWYMAGVEHGDLANAPAHFPALSALLAEGTTDALDQRPPAVRGAPSTRALRTYEPAYYPDEAALVASALWMGRRRPELPAPVAAVAVSVVHGNLAFARHMVAVGHYSGDSIVGAEAYLDRVLGGRLRARRELGLYPGPLGTSEHFSHPHPGGLPRGALVVGLGEVGELTASTLTATFARALLEFARALDERPDEGWEPVPGRERPLEIRLSSLLIGTGAGGFSVRTSVTALLRGLARANEALGRSQRSKRLRFVELELIEIRQDMALEAARTLARLGEDPELREQFSGPARVKQGLGGHAAGYDGVDPEWWHRIQILTQADGAMRFTSLTQRARAEETLLPNLRASVDSFVANAVGSTREDPEVSRTLFEMLLPNRLKDGTALRSNLVLIVDEDAARYPWELLVDRWSGNLRPPSVESGMLRQLQTVRFRAEPRLTVRERALVIGEPRTGLAPLPGARREAKKVHDTLSALGFGVRLLVGTHADGIHKALHADGYQILHLAGHGVYRERLGERDPKPCPTCRQTLPDDRDLQSGMVIGPDLVLAAKDVEQMRQVPELVFINCCHLGRTDGAPGSFPKDRHRLAANLAVAFIRMGVRAVIAAGWAVNDAAALTFCETFYQQMHAGQAFGEAVRLAREETWNNHPGVNTWGAYQCYGDQAYRLRVTAAGDGDETPPRPYVGVAEALADLTNLIADAQAASRGDADTLKERLSEIDQRLERARRDCGEDDRHWAQHGEVLAARGLACAELGQYVEAVRDLDAALASDAPGISRDLVEIRARCQSRVALEMHSEGRSDAAQAMFDGLLDELGGEPHPSLERVYTLASIYWRRIQVIERKERRKTLEDILALYNGAIETRADAEVDALGSYSRLLWLTAHYLLTAYTRQTLEEVCPEFDAWCERIKDLAKADDRGGLRADITELEVDLLYLIRHRERIEDDAKQRGLSPEDGVEAEQKRLSQRLGAILRRGLSGRQWSGLKNNLRQLEVLLREATVKHSKGAPIAKALLERLEREE